MPERAPATADLRGRDEILFLGAGGPVGRLIAVRARGDRREVARLRAMALADWEKEVLALREASVGPHLEAELGCPACGTVNLLVFDVADLPREAAPPPDDAPLALRALTAGDVADLEAAGHAGEPALAFLLARAADLHDAAAAAWLAGPQRHALTRALESLAAGLALDLATGCVQCGADLSAPFDVSAFVAAELAGRAERLLDEIHLIASTYHWSERDILDLPYRRRQDYVGRILAAQSLPSRLGAVA